MLLICIAIVNTLTAFFPGEILGSMFPTHSRGIPFTILSRFSLDIPCRRRNAK